MIGDLREFLAACREIGEVRDVDGADWNEEIGALTEAAAELIENPPALLFDNITGYPAGYRVFSLPLASHRRIAVALGIDPDKTNLEVLREASNRMNRAQAQPLPPVEVGTGPVMENVLRGDRIDLLKFPVPLYHASDGGRYLGTGDSLLNRDPESGFINMGTYRQEVHGRDLLGLWMSPGQQGRQICQRYWDRGEACPVAATYGTDPQVFFPSHTALPWGVCELDVAGGLRGAPVEVILGPLTGLPIPARAEIAIEGEVPPPNVEAADEGPFGEWPGYYSGGTRGTGEAQPVIRVKALYHRNDPIILSMPPLWPGAPEMGIDFKAALLWDQLESAGIQDVAGVWVHSRYLIVVAIKQRYAGHAKQTGMAVLGLNAIARNGRLVVIVDEDIDPSNIKEVLWAMETRVDPASDIEVVDNCWSTPLDPRMPPSKREAKDHTNGRAIFYAVRPFTWKDHFPRVSRSPRELRRQVMEKYFAGDRLAR
ncbi:MAG: UbiD family decarboxylase [Chloroflexota bacterium]